MATSNIDGMRALVKKGRRREDSVTICLQGDLLRQRADLADRLGRADEADADGLRVQLERVDAAVDEASVEFTFTALPRAEYDAIESAHPGADKADAWDVKTFPPALVAACCTSPAMTLDDATALAEFLSAGDMDLLFNTAWKVNQEASRIPFSESASAVMRRRASR